MDSIPYLSYEYSKQVYIYEEDSAVYFFNNFGRKFQKLYDFKQKIGSTWYYNYDYNMENDNKVDTIKMKVNAIETIYLNGQKGTKYYYTYSNVV